ncbi:tyrosine-type recombinase/integrase [Thiohalophilus sp.]|uniref:tyrosine-type recombinase/integrase n=1 Tax=Thiohalophilus sp. TaxID=3028392 RepID=UPI002ACD3432|nr:tyrosine-type recombinase/integrase [Thiohalophilus sp.]MDZ7804700.1 tyrosine-type recombinase/integrase [Thiohalophilus sp.]
MSTRSTAPILVDRSNKWHKLGKSLHEALQAYADMNHATGPITTLGHVMDRYRREILPSKAVSTQKTQAREIGTLRQVFGHMRPDDVTPQHIYTYLDQRPPIKGNREKSLLSHIYSSAIRWGAAADNPCRLVKRNPEKPRTRYVTDQEYLAIRDIMPAAVQLAMDLAIATGLRQGDILSLTLANWSDDGLTVKTGKTGKTLIYQRTAELAAIIEQCKKLPSRISTLYLIHNRHGQPYTGDGFRAIWQRRMRQAVADGLITERYTFHDLRAKAGSESDDDRLLGHQNPATLHRVYKRAPVRVTPIHRKNNGK